MTTDDSLHLRNLTDADRELLAQIDVTTKAQLDKLGADKAYLLLQESALKPDTEMLYRLRGAEKDIDWKILAERDSRRAKSRFADIDEP